MLPITLLAQGTAHSAAESVASLFDRIDPFADPTTLFAKLEQIPAIMAVLFVAVGLTCLLKGYQLYKPIVILLAMLTGIIAGFQMGAMVESEMIVAVCLGVLLAVVAWPLMKYAVAVAGGLAGAFIGANIWSVTAIELAKHGVAANPDMPWIGALIGLITVGFLSFLVFNVAVVVFTSMSGSVLAVIGTIALLLQNDVLREQVITSLTNKPVVLPLLIIVPAVVGLVIQQQWGAFKPASVGAKGGAPAKA